MEPTSTCPECGVAWPAGETCQDFFHQMLFWEGENPANAEVHHLMVLCYHLQHPSLYSPEGLRVAIQLLVDFLERGLSPAEVRRRNRLSVSSAQRNWKIKGTLTHFGTYQHPVIWTMTCGDVVVAGADRYVDSVKAWARSVYKDLKASNNFSS